MAYRQYTRLARCFYEYAEERYTMVDYDSRNQLTHRCGKYWMEYGAIAEILEFPPRVLSLDNHGIRSYQNAGSVATPQGRLVTFPSVLEHRL